MAEIATRPLRLGILSTANIARQFLSGLAASKLVTVTTVASRELGKAQAFAREHGIARALGSYEALLADPDIDAIYNPLPNSLHAAWSIKAARARKHILCEKPLAITATEVRAMFAAAREHGVHLVEAYPYRAQPQTLAVRDLVRGGGIGEVKLVRANFGFLLKDMTNIRAIPELGGGAIYDLGCYTVSFVTMVAQAKPIKATASARWAATGVDESIAATIEFENGVLGQISCSIGGAYHRHASIIGTEGTIETTFANHTSSAEPPSFRVRRRAASNAPVETVEVAGGDGFLAEADAFARLIAHGPSAWTGVGAEESLDIARIIDAILASAKTGVPVAIAT